MILEATTANKDNKNKTKIIEKLGWKNGSNILCLGWYGSIY